MPKIRTYILVGQLVRQSHALWLVLDGLAVNDGALELLDNAPMDRVALRHGTSPLVSLITSGQVSAGRPPVLAVLTKSSTVHLDDRSTTGAE
jgi:hypothetical protein